MIKPILYAAVNIQVMKTGEDVTVVKSKTESVHTSLVSHHTTK
jgi:hypothetical protein